MFIIIIIITYSTNGRSFKRHKAYDTYIYFTPSVAIVKTDIQEKICVLYFTDKHRWCKQVKLFHGNPKRKTAFVKYLEYLHEIAAVLTQNTCWPIIQWI